MESQKDRLIEIDGSYGEGGGQVLRTALALSAILQRPMRVCRIRAGRKNPGLQPQHLMAVKALARITDARTEGVRIGSESIAFIPGKINSGEYRFDVGTAGSVTLLLQALLPPLCLAQGSSRLTLVGGTHVSWSPPYHYLSEVLFPTLKLMGVSVEARIEKWGWYPGGGGIVHVDIRPSPLLKTFSLLDRGSLKKICGLSATSHLARHVGERQRDYAVRRIGKELKIDAEITVLLDVPADGPGSFLFLEAHSERVVAGFSSLGERGKPAEEVAKDAVDSLKDYLELKGCLDPYLADQIALFTALAKGRSSFSTTRMTEHLLTNLWVIQHFYDIEVFRSGEKGEEGKVEFFNEQ